LHRHAVLHFDALHNIPGCNHIAYLGFIFAHYLLSQLAIR
jgi:hypothetical protein